jgi:transposase
MTSTPGQPPLDAPLSSRSRVAKAASGPGRERKATTGVAQADAQTQERRKKNQETIANAQQIIDGLEMPEASRAIIKELFRAMMEELAHCRETIQQQAEEIAGLKRALFGQKSERCVFSPEDHAELDLGDQRLLIGSAEGEPSPTEEPAPEPPPAKGGSKPGRKIRRLNLPMHLPKRQQEIIPLAVQAHPEHYVKIGEKITEQLEIEPGRMVVLVTVRPTYKLAAEIDNPLCPPICAPAPSGLVSGQYLGPQLITEVLLAKYLNHSPLYRQARNFYWRYRVSVSESTLSDAVGYAADAVEQVIAAMAKEVWAGGYFQLDLTPHKYLDISAKAGQALTGQMWVIGEPEGNIIYHWATDKKTSTGQDWIPHDYVGDIQFDGGSELQCLFLGGIERTLPMKGARQSGCHTHARRRFEAAYKQSGNRDTVAAQFIKIIAELYAIEREARERRNEEKLSAEEYHQLRYKLRQATAPGILARYKALLDQHMTGPPAPLPKSLLGKAIRYAHKQWPRLVVYIEDGKLEIDNNLVENAIRPCALGKKNHLFIGHPSAGHRAAHFYSLIGTCLRLGLNPHEYLTWLLGHVHATAKGVDFASLTPKRYVALMAKTPELAVAA